MLIICSLSEKIAFYLITKIFKTILTEILSGRILHFLYPRLILDFRSRRRSCVTFDTWDVELKYARFARAIVCLRFLRAVEIRTICVQSHYRNLHAGYDKTGYYVRSPRSARMILEHHTKCGMSNLPSKAYV